MPLSAMNYMGGVHESIRPKVAEVIGAVEAAGHRITYVWGYDPNPGNVEHHCGLAADIMVFEDRSAGDFVADYLWANGARLGVHHEIWWQRIRSRFVVPGVWRAMADRGSPTNNHHDHVHVLFDETPYIGPGRDDDKSSRDHERGTATERVQRIVAVADDGLWGPSTDTAVWALRAVARGDATREQVTAVQGMAGIAQDGIVGPNTDAACASLVARLQAVLNVTEDGVWGPNTNEAFVTLRKKERIGGGPADKPKPPVEKPKPPVEKPKPPEWDAGDVRQVQHIVKVHADGLWGDLTDRPALGLRAVARGAASVPHTIKRVQRMAGVAEDGIVGPDTSEAVGQLAARMQDVLGVHVDGAWGPNTDDVFLRMRRTMKGAWT